tara:strand:- start:1089 stop:1295 length:207 start_codon:yes stop_codon:yes gene_type:complete
MKLTNNIKRIIDEERNWFLDTEIVSEEELNKLDHINNNKDYDLEFRKKIDERVKEIISDIETRILRLF